MNIIFIEFGETNDIQLHSEIQDILNDNDSDSPYLNDDDSYSDLPDLIDDSYSDLPDLIDDSYSDLPDLIDDLYSDLPDLIDDSYSDLPDLIDGILYIEID